MANPSESTYPLRKLGTRVSDPSCSMDASRESEYITALACESDHATTSSSKFFTPCSLSSENEGTDERREGTSVEDEIERSKVHWSQLSERSNLDDDKVAELSNVEVFKSLQRHPTWGGFFPTFGDGGFYDVGKLVVGERFAAGAQAELYHVCVTWRNPWNSSNDRKRGDSWVLKVFRNGTFLRDLQKQWPQGIFKEFEERVEWTNSGKCSVKYTCEIRCGTLLPYGRFAFLLVREGRDLRTLIDHRMKAKTCLDSGPFMMSIAVMMMYRVARGMDRLHNLEIIHRDLKASNVLYDDRSKDSFVLYVADFECSIGVVGTGFFRAPEILQALKDKVVWESPNLFTKAGDVYSYGMLCYEILTGKLPFEGHRTNDYDLVLEGHRPEVPEHVDEWTRDLLHRCWHFDPLVRPTFREIMNLFEGISKDCEEVRKDREALELLSYDEAVDKVLSGLGTL